MFATIEYCGGLGNQLFQIFALLSYCIDNNKTPVLKYLKSSPSITFRPTYWDTVFSEFKNFNILEDGVKISENCGMMYTQLPFFPENVILSGYFQSYKYFNHNFNKICEDLKIQKKQDMIFEEFSKTYLKKVEFQKIVSVHFRLGDYKHLQHAHPLLPSQYYANALDIINENVKEPFKILCFCEQEDIQQVNSIMMGISNSYTIVSNDVDKVDDWKQVFLMSLCDWNIIANSTFSWWGAMFNKNRSNVIYPSKWFHTDTPQDLVPLTWNMCTVNNKIYT